MARYSCRTTTDSFAIDSLEMIGTTRTIRFSIFGLLMAFLVAGSGAPGVNGDAGGSAYSGASASAFASASASATAFADSNAFVGFGNFPGVVGGHDGHKGIRSYDDSGYGDNDRRNSGVKGNRDNGCSKCKWEDDDYWEKDEEETESDEGDETDCYDGDDGRYREDGHDHGHGHGHGHGGKVGSPLGVQKLGNPGPIGQASYARTGSSGIGAPFGTAPVNGGYPRGGGPAPGSPWNNALAVSDENAYRPGQPSHRRPESSWNVDSGTTSKPARNRGYDDSGPGIGSQSSPTWNAGPVGSPNADTADRSGGSWNNGPETGSGCSSGSYRSGTGCAQGSSGPGPIKQAPLPFAGIDDGNVRKQGSPDYSTNPTGGYGPTGTPVGCSAGAYGNCAGNPVGQTGPRDNSGGSLRGPAGNGPAQSDFAGTSYGPVAGRERYPGSDVGNGASARPHGGGPATSGNTGIQGTPGSPGYAKKPQSPGGTVGSASSSGAVHAGAGSSFPSSTAHPTYSPVTRFEGSPFSNAGPSGSPNGESPDASRKPSYGGVKAGPSRFGATPNAYAGKPHHGYDEPGSGSDSYPGTVETANGGKPAPGGSLPRHRAPKDGDSKIFYINVSPAPGAPVGVKPRTTTIGPSGGTGTTKSSHPPGPYVGFDATTPSYRPGPRPDTDTTKPSYRPAPYGGIGTTRPSGSSGGWPGSGGSGAQASAGATSGSLGGFDASPSDLSQNSRSPFPGGNGRPTGHGSGGPGCDDSVGCAPASTYADGTKHADALPGGGIGPYRSNPFLTGKHFDPLAGDALATTTDKPIGRGNPFLEGAAAGAGAWSHPGVDAGVGPSGDDKNAGETAKPIGKDNPFLGEPERTQGDAGIESTRGPTTSGISSLHDKSPSGTGEPFGRYPDSNWNSGPANHGTFPTAPNLGSGSGGGVGIGPEGLGNFQGQTGHGNEDSFHGAFSGAFSGSQASSYADSKAGSLSGSAVPGTTFGQANAGSWASSGASAGSSAGSGSWSSSGASAYASSSAGSWSGTGPVSVKG